MGSRKGLLPAYAMQSAENHRTTATLGKPLASGHRATRQTLPTDRRLALAAGPGKNAAMHLFLFMAGTLVILATMAGRGWVPTTDQPGLLLGGLTLGGAYVICALFAWRMPWHGRIGAGVVAFLALARTAGNVPSWLAALSGDRSRGGAPLLELGMAFLSLAVLIVVLRALARERLRRMLAAEDAPAGKNP